MRHNNKLSSAGCLHIRALYYATLGHITSQSDSCVWVCVCACVCVGLHWAENWVASAWAWASTFTSASTSAVASASMCKYGSGQSLYSPPFASSCLIAVSRVHNTICFRSCLCYCRRRRRHRRQQRSLFVWRAVGKVRELSNCRILFPTVHSPIIRRKRTKAASQQKIIFALAQWLNGTSLSLFKPKGKWMKVMIQLTSMMNWLRFYWLSLGVARAFAAMLPVVYAWSGFVEILSSSWLLLFLFSLLVRLLLFAGTFYSYSLSNGHQQCEQW